MSASKIPVPHRLSVCMIVKNEADLLDRCLKSVKGCADEIIVVDTGSSDNSVEVAKKAGATVIQSDWRDDFSFSRNISIRQAANEWILWLDADDVVPPASIPVICSLKQKKTDCVFGFVVLNEKPGNTGSEFIQARMFPNRDDIYFEHRIHEQMMPSALRLGMKLVETGVVVEHHGYADPEKVKIKAGRNVTLLLDEWNQKSPDPVMAVEIADSYSMLGEFDNAEKWYATVLGIRESQTVFPELASQACLGLGNIRNRQENYKEAAEFLSRSLSLSPGRPDVMFSLAVAQDMGGDLESAAKTLQAILAGGGKALMVGIDFREARIKAYLRLERVFGDLKKNAEALVMAQQAVEALPNRPEIHDMAGRILLKNNRVMDSLHAFEKSLKLNTESNLEGYIGLCRIYSLAGRKEIAVTTLNEIQPLFEKKPLYWAFRQVFFGAGEEKGLPPGIEAKDIETEKKTLSKLYGIG